MKVQNNWKPNNIKMKPLGKLLLQQSNFKMHTSLVKPGLRPMRLKVSSDYLNMLHTPQKHKDFKDMLKFSIKASHQFTMVLISTMMSSRQDFMLLNLNLTTSRKKLHSQEMLSSLGKKPLPLLKLNTLDIALNHGEKLLRQKTSTRNLISL